MPGIRRRIWFSVCGTLMALMLAIGPLSMTGFTHAAAQGTADDAEILLAAASDMADELETVDAPRTLELEQAESDSITLNFLNPSDEPITDFYLTFRAEAPRDGIDDPFDVGVFYRDQGNGEPYLNLVLLSDGGDGPVWGVFNEDGTLETGDIDPDLFPTDEGSRYNVEIAVIGDEMAFAINGDPVALVDISSNSDAGRISLASGLFGNTQVDGDIVDISRISLYDLGDGDTGSTTGTTDNGTTGTSTGGDAAASEIYDFVVNYDPELWELRSITQTEQNYTSLGLDNVEVFDFVDGQTQVLMFAGESTNSVRECVNLDLQYFEEDSTRYDYVGIAEDDDGDPIQGRTQSGDGYYTVIYLDDNGPADAEYDTPEPITVYIECRPIVDGESLMLIEQYARDAVFNDAIDGRIELLAGIEVGGGGSTSSDTDEPIEDEDQPTEDDDQPIDDADLSDGTLIVIIDGDVEGEATIESSGSTRARVIVTVDGADEGALVVIQEGSCDDLAGESAYDVGEIDDQGESSGRVRITPEDLAGDYALTIVDADTEDYEEPLGCGDIG